MPCKKAEIFIPEDWKKLRENREIADLGQNIEATKFYILAANQYQDSFINYPPEILFIGEENKGHRVAGVFLFREGQGLFSESDDLEPIGDEETLERITAYHNCDYWYREIIYGLRPPLLDVISAGIIRHQTAEDIAKLPKSHERLDPPNKRIILAVNNKLVDRLVVPHLRDTLKYRKVQKYSVSAELPPSMTSHYLISP